MGGDDAQQKVCAHAGKINEGWFVVENSECPRRGRGPETGTRATSWASECGAASTGEWRRAASQRARVRAQQTAAGPRPTAFSRAEER